jgi:enoyl-CoA hydratase
MTSPIVSLRRERTLHLTIDRPAKRNALNRETVAALAEALAAAVDDSELIAVVIRGAGEKAFAAGGDLRELQALDEPRAVAAYHGTIAEAFRTIREFPLPVVAALNGDALGGGFELALACDLRVADAHTRVALLQGTLALPTAWGGGGDLMQLVGPARALELLASSRFLAAAEAKALGLVDFVVPQGETLSGFVEGMMQSWGHQRPQVMRAYKAQTLAYRMGVPRQRRDLEDFQRFVDCWMHPDHFQAAERKIAGLGR